MPARSPASSVNRLPLFASAWQPFGCGDAVSIEKVEEEVFTLFASKQPQRTHRVTLTDAPAAPAGQLDPQAQLQLVSETVENLEQIRILVRRLPELPVGSRHDLMAQLAATSDSLRSLYFLDTVY